MVFQILLTLSLAALTLAQIDAPVISNEPAGAAYQAMLQSTKPVQGQIEGVSNTNKTGVTFNVNFYAFPSGQGPFEYHIHEFPVPADGNCTGTGAHLDPYGRTESPPCTLSAPQTCQLGDLSGKHGNMSVSTNFQAFYTDLYLSTQPGALAFFGNRSVVVHNAAGARLNCGNFTNAGAVASSATASTATALPTAASKSASSAASGSATATPGGNGAGARMAERMNGGWPVAGAVVAVLAAL